ncbi:Hypothetical predicted protein [Cloeon dipterum]|uniref:GDNF/GAS1 domain-containing protein n=1 Tax=Cloeon dipterum TaxID=197152 RepID=A0A8S1C917_9INSE|nr:Hypothetical predicted protein [Cloeon dipterum]
MGRPKSRTAWRRTVLPLLLLLVHAAGGSEFPERECCDPVYPLAAPPSSTTPYPSVPTATGRAGNPKSAVAILNCVLARTLCFEDASCSAIVEIIPRVCGAEQVACSTVTVTKCQAALRTLQAFPFFRPTCLCREPHVDPECSSFRDFLFDHPCIYVNKKEKDPYPVDALPTCNHALSVCQLERKCIKLFEDFKTNCKVRDGQCKMEERDACHSAWTKLRLSPIFGCICPNNHMKRRCDRIFSLVNHNPCVDVLPASLDLSGTDSALYPYEQDNKFREFWFPPTSLYPYFLLPPTYRPWPSKHPPPPPTHYYHGTHEHHYFSVDEPNLVKHVGGASAPAPHVPISVKVIPAAAEHESSAVDAIDTQLENPLYGVRGGASHADIFPLPPANNTIDEKYHWTPSYTIRPAIADNEMSRTFSFQSTCHLALDMCNNNYNCRSALLPVLQYCDASRCARDACMAAMQTFYRSVDLKWSLEVAFCLCKKTDNKHDECLIAQEQLHPMCAQRVDGAAIPTCHSLAEVCREEAGCRVKLEYYEQSCAVDSVTKKCAGSPSECRKAMLGILGTSLRSSCACKGTDFSQLYDCLGWQRLLWVNPCVVESQRDFQASKIAAMLPPPTTAPPPPPPPPVQTPAWTPMPQPTPPTFGVPRTPPPTAASTMPTATRPTRPTAPPAPAVPVPASPPTPSTTTSTTITTTTTTTQAAVVTTEATEPTTTPTTPTTTLPTTTTEPPKFCIVQRPQQKDQYILEGTGKRLYRENEEECSELCQCNEGEQLVCNTLCVQRAPCKTDLAFYNHAAPAYQAYRGLCKCYSGRFICMRPTPDSYSLPHGVFLFLGYSEVDENLLKPHINLTIHDSVEALQHVMRFEPSSPSKGECVLFLYNITKENVILVAKLVNENFTYSKEGVSKTPYQQLQHEKEECSAPLQELSNKINKQHADVHSHQLLSIIKIADVEVKVPESSGGGAAASLRGAADPATCLLVVIVAHLLHNYRLLSS